MAKRSTRTTSIIRFKSDNSLEELERATGRASKKAIVVVLRWVLVIACAGLILSSDVYHSNRVFAQLIVLSLFLTNLVLAALPQKLFDTKYFDQSLLFFDVMLITSCIWFSGELGSDLYLLYFLSLMVAALGETLKAISFSAVLVALVYLVINMGMGGFEAVLRPEFLIRVPFFFVVAMFYGYFAQLVRRERSKRVEYKVKLDVNETVREVSSQLGSSVDCLEILTILANSLCEFCDSPYCAVVSLGSEEILVESGEWDRYSTSKKTLTLVNSLRVQLRNYTEEEVPLVTSSTGMKQVSEGQTQLCFTNDNFTFLPLEGTTRSDLYICMIGRFRSEVLGYASLVICSAWISVERALQYVSLQQEVERGQMLAEKLKEALNFRAAFIERVSGELKTPLYSIIGLAELLLNEGYGSLNEDQRGVVSRVIDGAKGMRGVVNTFLEHAKFDSGQFQLNVSNGEIGDMLKHLEEVSQPWFKGTRVSLAVQCDSLVPTVSTDWNLVQQILLNFISNALRYTPEGTIVLSASFDELTERVEFSVTDSGVGMSKDRMAQIFFPFRPVEQNASNENRSGLGLAINKLQAAALGGQIDAKSCEGKGSTFTLFLPLSVRGEVDQHDALSEQILQ